jgi:hypothetical protein
VLRAQTRGCHPWAGIGAAIQITSGLARMREPDFIIGTAEDPYLRRWWVIPRNRWFNVYLHHFLHGDDDRALHDHPWINVSLLLRGRYIEHMPGSSKLRRPWVPVLRRATASHRIALIEGRPAWSLFLTGPVVREWGFHCPRGWVHWKQFTSPDDKGSVGKGCGE